MADSTSTFFSKEEICKLLSSAFPEFDKLYTSTEWRHTSRTRFLYHLLDIHMVCKECFHDDSQQLQNSRPLPYQHLAPSTTRPFFQKVLNQNQRSCQRYLSCQSYTVENSGRMRDNVNDSSPIVESSQDRSIYLQDKDFNMQDTVPSETASLHLNIPSSNISVPGNMSDTLDCTKDVPGDRRGEICDTNQPIQIKEEIETDMQCNNQGNHARQTEAVQAESSCPNVQSPPSKDTRGGLTSLKQNLPSLQNSQGVGTRRYDVNSILTSKVKFLGTKLCSQCNVCYRDNIIHVCNDSNKDVEQQNSLSVDGNENIDQEDQTESDEDSDKDLDPDLWYQIQKFKIFHKRRSRRGYVKPPGPTECLQCQINFPNTEDLCEHMRKHCFFLPAQSTPSHRSISTKLKFCKLCKLYFKYHGSHITKCVDPKPYKCPVCKQAFSNKHDKAKHYEIHHEAKKYLCDTCGKLYGTQKAFMDHKKLHENRRSIVCTICGAAFNIKKELSKHEPIHDPNKQFECKHCHRMFTQSSNLKRHLRTHTGEKPYKCDLCRMTFTHNVSLKTHKKSKHGIDWWADSKGK